VGVYLQAGRLALAFQEFQSREALRLPEFYVGRLTALEEALLEARERVFAVAADGATKDSQTEQRGVPPEAEEAPPVEAPHSATRPGRRWQPALLRWTELERQVPRPVHH
jgi:hypothetical protein